MLRLNFLLAWSHPNHDKWPYDHPFHLILNLAVNGKWMGSEAANESGLTQKMLIDYVRVYDQKP